MQQEAVSVHFGWTVPADGFDEPAMAIPGVTGSHIVEELAWGDPDLADLLRSVGLHRDQEDVEELRDLVRMTGEIGVRALGAAIERRAHEAMTGLVVDLRFGSFEILEHPAVRRGTVLLVNGSKARLLNVRQGARIAEVIAEAASPAV